MFRYKIYVGGEFIETHQELKVYNPYDNSLVGTTFLAGTGELETAINKSKLVAHELRDMPGYKRYSILMNIADKIRSKREELSKILAREAGKPIKYALGEIDRAIQVFIVAAEESKRLPKEYLSIDWTPAGENKEGLVKYFPVGLIAGIAPFNFPLNLAVHKIAPAIASGNAIILKPARSTPLSVLELAKIVDETDLPKGALSVLPMDREAGNQLVTDSRINMLSFTGSPAVGWKMKSEAGKKKVVLELGGNAGVIVSETADLNLAAKKCVVGGFAYSGQVCIHVQRIFVHEKVFSQFIDLFIELTKNLEKGDPCDEKTDISSMIDLENAIRVEEWVNEAVANGAKILHGGKRVNAFFEPTLITGTKPDMKVCALEIFGPVVAIEKISDFNQAVQLINNSEYGLQAGVFTNTISEMNKAFNELEVGGVIINDVPTFRVDHMPYGGIKNSGFGREGIKYAIFEMLEPRLMVKNTDY
ncbi:MAG: aldehyde dehydrogenase [Bacteroidetes bacterium GWC2_33_15]|nr:MAG: aldehyde dehydrogenase [Bacteroidetes bacterium GWA2_33_15]OFX51695.1 MAG: aldehyde dehydrogenase [Bacteroidetes bacterium GWC2_33_15]OFX66243.1 MAG: aldehyde dehydrogenase [Bacteroidetes bacterium GWB2_32_14]OFX66995.1 MAG: aldehyde dehydrogenase [Bacteroidetes bacterium GWD2_33_33]HAN17694.1 aldehyde dehydrogenase [Bacteroidales bacterium]